MGQRGTRSCEPTHDPRPKEKTKKNLSAADVHGGMLANLYTLSALARNANLSLIAMHGTLLGWNLNEQLYPWGGHLDFSFFHKDGDKLRKMVNIDLGRDCSLVDKVEGPHPVEFRLSHLPTGVYTDMTSLRISSDPNVLAARAVSRPKPRRGGASALYAMKASFRNLCCGHLYRIADITPTFRCQIEDVWVDCPHRPHKVLMQEYKKICSADTSQCRFVSVGNVTECE